MMHLRSSCITLPGWTCEAGHLIAQKSLFLFPAVSVQQYLIRNVILAQPLEFSQDKNSSFIV